MSSVIKLELKKILSKKSILITWILALLLAKICVRPFSLTETYADIFSKYYGLAPLMGIIMFMIFAGSYVVEYSSNMDELIKTTKNGRKQLVLAKSIANGIAASLINVSILLVMVSTAFSKFKFDGLDTPIKNLWYFGNSGSNITVIQMLIIMTITIIAGSFLFAQLGLFLSSISKKAVMPFFVGGIIMGLPYFSEVYGISQLFPKKIVVLTPLWGMYSCQILRFKAPNYAFLVFGLVTVIGSIVLYNLTLNSFSKER
jgi:hypothetical protein